MILHPAPTLMNLAAALIKRQHVDTNLSPFACSFFAEMSFNNEKKEYITTSQ
jgi:hypothetical protein